MWGWPEMSEDVRAAVLTGAEAALRAEGFEVDRRPDRLIVARDGWERQFDPRVGCLATAEKLAAKARASYRMSCAAKERHARARRLRTLVSAPGR